MSNIILPSGGDEGYQIQRSLRLRSSASAYLNRTPAAVGSQTTWSLSIWLKRGAVGTNQTLFHAGTNSGPDSLFYFGANDTFDWLVRDASTATVARRISTQVFRDPSAHGHFLFVWDTSNATAASRMRVYYNNSEITAFSASTNPASNLTSALNGAVAHRFGYNTANVQPFDGLIEEINFIDGQALTPSAFGAINPVTGVWSAKKYSGTYGTNGFYLPFTDNSASTAAAIGADKSGNGNNWTPNNISVTAGATYDSMIDVPTMWADGGNGRGNYATLNPLNFSSGFGLDDGNLRANIPNVRAASSTISMSSGKWYAEFTLSQTGIVGISKASFSNIGITSSGPFDASGGYGYVTTGNKRNSGADTAYGATWTSGDVIGIAFDADSGTLAFYKNGVSQGTAFSSIPNDFYVFSVYGGFGTTNPTYGVANFGQRPFSYTPPTGFKALHTGNLPDPVIKQGNKYFNPVLYTGNGGTLAVTGVGFQPDLVWAKDRAAARSNVLVDSVRGAALALFSDATSAETAGYVSSINSDGFTVVVTPNSTANTNGEAYVSWNWKANGAAVSNTAGSITSQVSAGVTQGFSVVTYTGTGANATVGHGLGVAPKMVIVKQRNAVQSWPVYHASNGAANVQYLDLTNAVAASTAWQSVAPSSSVFSIGTSAATNTSAATYVAYCFSEVAGYSKFGSYVGNGNADGPFVYCGFRPRYVMVKRTNSVTSWAVWDSARNTYNATDELLLPNSSGAAITPFAIDLLSNGFKPRIVDGTFNASGGTYIFMAFAESPFKNSLAR